MSLLFSAVGTSVPPLAVPALSPAQPPDTLSRYDIGWLGGGEGRYRKPSTDVEGAPNKGLAE